MRTRLWRTTVLPKADAGFFEMMKSDRLRQLIAKVPGYDARETGRLTVVKPK
jgi:hypothetical protein